MLRSSNKWLLVTNNAVDGQIPNMILNLTNKSSVKSHEKDYQTMIISLYYLWSSLCNKFIEFYDSPFKIIECFIVFIRSTKDMYEGEGFV